MTELTCKQILYDFIVQNEGWHKKVHLYGVAEDFSPETVGRKLRELESEGKIEVGLYNGKYTKGLAQYRLKGELKKVVYKVEGIGQIIRYN